MKRWWVWIAAAGVGAAFALASAALFFRKRHPGLVAAKLRLGALLIALTASSCSTSCVVSCYEPMPPKPAAFPAGETRDGACLARAGGNLAVVIRCPEADAYCARWLDGSEAVVAASDLVAVDGAFDAGPYGSEDAIVPVPTDLAPGSYRLLFFEGALADLSPEALSFSTLDVLVE